MEPRLQDPLEGRTFSHYRIRHRLGGGGMGVVYKAEDVRLKRTVAIKFLPPHWSDDEIAKTRFIREAQAASAIEHPNICAVHDIDTTEDGQLYIVMPFYSGETLKKKIGRGPLPVAKALDYFEQVLRGLERAHQCAIVHRDIKPANLIVTTDEAVKIVDFGLAKLVGGGELTRVGQALGTVEYMSPEQTRAEALDARSDLWSAGVVLFEMLTGRRPFRGAPAIATEAIRSGEKPRVSSLRRGIPPRLETVLERLLCKEREKRFDSATQVLEALETPSPTTELEAARTLTYGLPVAAPRASRIRMIGAAIAVLLVVAGVLGWLSLRGQRAPPPAPQQSRMRIAVLAPESVGLGDAEADWPRLIQTFLAAQLTGVEEFGVLDPLTLNGLIESNLGTVQLTRGPGFYDLLDRSEVDLMIDGALFQQDGGFRLVANLVRAEDGETLLSRTVAAGADDLLEAMRQLSEQLVEYLQIEALGKKRGEDLAPWVSPRKHKVEALRAFMQASEYIFRYEPGGGRYLSRALELDPEFITARVWLVSALMRAGERDEAAAHVEILRTLEPSASRFEQTMIAWAGAFVEEDLGEQARHLGIALGYSPENYILLANLGFVRYEMEDCEAALDALAPPVAAGWVYPPIYPVFAGCLVQQGRFPEARRILERASAMQPVHSGVYGMLRALSIHAGDSEGAARYAERAGIEVPAADLEEVGEVFFLTGSDSLRTGRPDRAVRLLRQAVLHKPQDARFQETLGEVLYQSGEKAEARDAFAAAIRLDGSRAGALLGLGRISEEWNDPKTAAAHYRAYLALQPSGPQAAEVRVWLDRLDTTADQ
jgi:tetratricopeptide (TPR) repeat protein